MSGFLSTTSKLSNELVNPKGQVQQLTINANVQAVEGGVYLKIDNGNLTSRKYVPYGNVYEVPNDPDNITQIDYLFLESQILPLIIRDTVSSNSEVLNVRVNPNFADVASTSSSPLSLSFSVVIVYLSVGKQEGTFLTESITLDTLNIYTTIEFESTTYSDSPLSTTSSPTSITITSIDIIEYDNYTDTFTTASSPLGVNIV